MLETQITIGTAMICALAAGGIAVPLFILSHSAAKIEHQRGEPPLWYVLGMIAFIAAVGAPLAWSGAPTWYHAFTYVFGGLAIGGLWAYFGSGWLVRRIRRRA